MGGELIVYGNPNSLIQIFDFFLDSGPAESKTKQNPIESPGQNALETSHGRFIFTRRRQEEEKAGHQAMIIGFRYSNCFPIYIRSLVTLLYL